MRLARRGGDLAALDAGRERLEDFVERWWGLEAGPNLERATLKSYASHWNVHALPRLGHLQLRQVTPPVVAQFRRRLEEDDVGSETIRRTMAMLQSMFARAVEWQLVPANPVAPVRKPKAQRKRAIAQMPPSIVERLRARLLAAGRHRDATIVSVLAYAGVRPQEALALRWRHVRENTLLVEDAIADGETKGQKTRRPPRSVDLLGPLRQDLAEWRMAQGRPGVDALVFPRARRRAVARSRLPQLAPAGVRPVRKKVKIASPRPYDLRHALVSLRIHEGELSIVELAEQLGHSTQTMLRTYAHVIAELKGQRVLAEQAIRDAREAASDLHAPRLLPTGEAAS
jgi:integrase